MHIRTSEENKIRVTELTRKLQLGPENVIARIALGYSISKGKKMSLTEMKDSKGKEYKQSVLFGNYLPFYEGLICTFYKIYKSDKDIPKYLKMHIDDGLELIDRELQQNPNLEGFDFLIGKIENGLKFIS